MTELVAPIAGAPGLMRHSPPELVIADAPGAGLNFTKAVDDGLWWRLLSIMFRVNTSATVADRTVRVEYRGADAVPFILAGNPVTYPASTTNEDFCFSVWQTQAAWEVGAANLGALPTILLQPSQDFRVTIVNVQAADAITRIRYVIERFWPPNADSFPAP